MAPVEFAVQYRKGDLPNPDKSGDVVGRGSGVIVLRTGDTESWFELAARQSTSETMALWMVNAAPSAAGRVKVGERVVG